MGTAPQKELGQNLAEVSLVVGLLGVLCIVALSTGGATLQGFYRDVSTGLAATRMPGLVQTQADTNGTNGEPLSGGLPGTTTSLDVTAGTGGNGMSTTQPGQTPPGFQVSGSNKP